MSSGAKNPSGIRFLLAQVIAATSLIVIVQAAWGFENAQQALAFYGVYHREPRNQLIHFFGVPGILWSLMIFMIHLPIPYFGTMCEAYLPANYSLTYGLVLALIYQVFYLWIDPLGGTLYAPILYAMYRSAVYLRRIDQQEHQSAVGTQATPFQWSGTGRLLSFALVLHVFSWYIQIHLGHKIYEGAQPAVMQSLGGALTVAPLFAFYEGLWLAGINKDLQNETLQLVDKYTIDLCSSGVEMRVCQTLGLE
jgi:uncharacterized membrane protein YGL010W